MTVTAFAWMWKMAVCSAQTVQPRRISPCNLDKGALFAVRYICLIEDKKLFGFRISEGSAKLLYAAAEQYALAHMDKQLNSLKFLRSLSAWDPDQQSKKD